MNALLRLFVNRPTPWAFACVCGAALLSGCAASPFATAQVDPASPVAAEVAKMARASTDYPSFSEIPPLPADQRPLREFGRAADQLEMASAKLDRETAPDTWTLTGTERFVNRAQALVAPGGDIDGSTRAASEAFARQIRERATPPPLPR